MKNQGISLISLIITIIVIIILAAIVIFTGFGATDSASFANFCQSVDNVQSAVFNKYADLRTSHAISGDSRNDEQLYKEVATGTDATQTGKMTVEGSYENINPTVAKSSNGMSFTLPKVRETNAHWYVTADGRVFNATGYVYDGKTYYTSSAFTASEVAANVNDAAAAYAALAE